MIRKLTLSIVGLYFAGFSTAETPQKDYATSCYAAYVTNRDNPNMQTFMGTEWENFEGADFNTRASKVEPHIGGMASWAYADNYAQAISGNCLLYTSPSPRDA